MATNSNNIDFTKEKPFEDGMVLYADDLNDLVAELSLTTENLKEVLPTALPEVLPVVLPEEIVDGKTIDVVKEEDCCKLSLHGVDEADAGTVPQKNENGEIVWKKIEASGSGGTDINETQLEEYLTENKYLKLVNAQESDPGVGSDLATDNIILVYEA